MSDPVLRLSREMHANLIRHLIRGANAREEAAFVFAKHDGEKFTSFDWIAVPPEGFVIQTPYHFELTDDIRARVIKHAHDAKASVIEFHSHTGNWPAQFSASDWSGFEEIVPHVWWRLKGRPYAAVVVTRNDFDAFAWLDTPTQPKRLYSIDVDGELLYPTGLSPLDREAYDWTI